MDRVAYLEVYERLPRAEPDVQRLLGSPAAPGSDRLRIRWGPGSGRPPDVGPAHPAPQARTLQEAVAPGSSKQR
jgi:hypothetical protein